jgi:hypothetical protein
MLSMSSKRKKTKQISSEIVNEGENMVCESCEVCDHVKTCPRIEAIVKRIRDIERNWAENSLDNCPTKCRWMDIKCEDCIDGNRFEAI